MQTPTSMHSGHRTFKALGGYLEIGEPLFRNVLFDQLCDTLPAAPGAQVMVFHAEIAPEAFTNWHCHNGATFFVALQGRFEAHFDEGILVRASAGEVYSEPVGRFHRGHNPDPRIPYVCIGVCITASGVDHVTNRSEDESLR